LADADIVFAARDWRTRVLAALGRSKFVQAFSRALFLPADWKCGTARVTDAQTSRQSAVAAIQSDLGITGWLRGSEATGRAKLALGYAWAARRELLDRHGFYDACIVGGGDRAMLCAAYGCFDQLYDKHRMNSRQRQRYLAWAQPFHVDVAGAVDCVDGDIFHLWHGDMEHRRYQQRHAELVRHDFDPFNDIAVAANGAWRWNSQKLALHDEVRSYFVSRHSAELGAVA
jgi:hypothetical protein